jgi:hypothetical protein
MKICFCSLIILILNAQIRQVTMVANAKEIAMVEGATK